MTAPGFLPLRQLVLVDLLGLMLAVRPGERAVIVLDGPQGTGRELLAAELGALARRVAGRDLHVLPMASFRRDPHRYDLDTLRREVLWPFRQGLRPVGAGELSLGPDAVLLLEGDELRRPELRGECDAAALVLGDRVGAGADEEAHRAYRLQARTWAPDWIVDNSDPGRPELLWPDPDEPQWFDQ